MKLLLRIFLIIIFIIIFTDWNISNCLLLSPRNPTLNWKSEECLNYWKPKLLEKKKKEYSTLNILFDERNLTHPLYTLEDLRDQPIHHNLDVHVCFKEKVVWLENHKTGSTSLRVLFRNLFNCTNRNHPWGNRRSTSFDLDDEILNTFFFFTFVRQPISRFISGFKEMMYQNGHREILRDKNLKDVVNAYHERGFNEHINTQSYEVGSRDRLGRLLPIHYIGRMETLELDLIEIFSRFNKTYPYMMPNSRPETLHSQKHLYDSSIDRETIKKLCKYLAQDFICFGYELPYACREID